MMSKLTIKVRLTLWYIIILTVILAVFSAFIYWNMENFMYKQVENVLRSQGEQINDEYTNNEYTGSEDSGNENTNNEYPNSDYSNNEESNREYSGDKNDISYNNITQNRGSEWLDISGLASEIKERKIEDTSLAVYGSNGKLISDKQGSSVFPGSINPVLAKQKSGYKIIEEEKGNKNKDSDWITVTMPIKQRGQTMGWLRLGRPLDSVEKVLNNLMIALVLGVIIILLIAVVGGYFLAWKALSPIERISRTAREISSNNLGQRIAEKETDDEVGRLTGTLNQLLGRLENAFKREKQFTADASHELRTPITVIRAHAEKGLRREDIDAENRHILEVIERQSDYMSHLIDQLLLLARSDIDQMVLEKEEFDINELLRMVTDEVEEIADKKQINISLESSGKELIIADQRMIIQLLINLLDNAIKYTPIDGKVSVSAERVGKQIQIQVKDTGVGISREEQEYIFERFYRVDKARSRRNGGTGLGLAICHWIVEAHGGSISVTSRTGEGSTFTILLPDKTK